jgi:hypothetical protein
MDRYMMKLLVCVMAGLACLSAMLLVLTYDFDAKPDETAKLKRHLSSETMKLRS